MSLLLRGIIRRLTGIESQEPGNRIKVRKKIDFVKVLEQNRIVECNQVVQNCEVFLQHERIVARVDLAQKLWDKDLQAVECQTFVREIDDQKWRCYRVDSCRNIYHYNVKGTNDLPCQYASSGL